MSLNAREAKGGGKAQEPIDPGTYPARLVAVVSLGLQPQSYNGETKEPRDELAITHELLDEFMKDDKGEDMTDKPRWLTETFALHNIAADRAKSTQRYIALDPELKHDGDWAKLIGTPEMVTVINAAGKGKNKGKVFSNVAGVSSMRAREAAKAPELVNDPLIFDFDNPDIKVWAKLPKFLQDKCKNALNFDGSRLQELLVDYKPDDKANVKEEVEADDEEADDKNW